MNWSDIADLQRTALAYACARATDVARDDTDFFRSYDNRVTVGLTVNR